MNINYFQKHIKKNHPYKPLLESDLKFRWVSGGRATYPPGSKFIRERQTSFEFVLVTAGSLKYHYNQESIRVPSEHLLLSQKGFRENYDWDSSAISCHDFFHFDISDLSKIKDLSTWPLVRRISDSDICYHLMKYILQLGKSGSEQSVEISDAMRLLFFSFLNEKGLSQEALESPLPEIVNKIFEYVRLRWESGMACAFTIEELCIQAHKSPAQVTRIFRKYFQMGPIQVLKMVRLQRAAIQLVFTTNTIQNIAYFNGFSNAFHFSKAFKNQYRMSPSEFRKRKSNTFEHPVIQKIPSYLL